MKLEELQVIKRQAGLYCLKKDGLIVYIGKSTNIYLRILEHIVKGVKIFDNIKCAYFEGNFTEAEVMEVFIIDIDKPKYNKLVANRDIFYKTLPTSVETATYDEIEIVANELLVAFRNKNEL